MFFEILQNSQENTCARVSFPEWINNTILVLPGKTPFNKLLSIALGNGWHKTFALFLTSLGGIVPKPLAFFVPGTFKTLHLSHKFCVNERVSFIEGILIRLILEWSKFDQLIKSTFLAVSEIDCKERNVLVFPNAFSTIFMLYNLNISSSTVLSVVVSL